MCFQAIYLLKRCSEVKVKGCFLTKVETVLVPNFWNQVSFHDQ